MRIGMIPSRRLHWLVRRELQSNCVKAICGTLRCNGVGRGASAVHFEKDGRLLDRLFSRLQALQSGQHRSQMPNAQVLTPFCGSLIDARVMTTADTLKMQNPTGKAGSNTYCVSLSSELPLKSRLEFVGRATADVGAPFVKVL